MLEKIPYFKGPKQDSDASENAPVPNVKPVRAGSRFVEMIGDSKQDQGRSPNSCPANDLHFDGERAAQGGSDTPTKATKPEQNRPTARETRLRLVLQEIEKEYEIHPGSDYASFPIEQITGMDWVLDVLEDLASFAKSRGARNIVNALVRTSVEIEKELAARKAP